MIIESCILGIAMAFLLSLYVTLVYNKFEEISTKDWKWIAVSTLLFPISIPVLISLAVVAMVNM